MSKVCLVVGGTGGLGRACAEDLASRGYKVVVAGRNKSKGDDIVSKVRAGGGEATFLAVDMKDEASIQKLHKDTVDRYGQLDVAVNAFGVTGDVGRLTDLSESTIHEVVQVNIMGTIFCMREQIRAMQSNPGGSSGRIVNFSSIYGLVGCRFGSIYAASKHAIIGLTKTAARECSNPKDNILINAVAPGVILTEMTAFFEDPSIFPDGEVKDEIVGMKDKYAQKRFGDVEDVAKAVRFLIDSPWVTGAVLEIDGGFGA